MKDFRTFDAAVRFYRMAKALDMRGDLKEQLMRAGSSVCLNLAEGRGRTSLRDQMRFFGIAMGSIRECQAILTLEDISTGPIWNALDHVAGSLSQVIRNARPLSNARPAAGADAEAEQLQQ